MYNSHPLRWFLHLRLLAFIGQALVLLLAVTTFELTVPWKLILFSLCLIPLSNLIAVRLEKRFSEKNLAGSLMVLDTVILTAVLSLGGGPTNPFTIFYLLQVVLSSLILNAAWTWVMTAVSMLGFASLFIFPTFIPEWEHHGSHSGLSLHLYGMLLAYAIASPLASFFLSGITSELKLKERLLERLENKARNQEKLATLTTITANATHELATPLSTIAVISHELESALKQDNAVYKIIKDDIELLKSQVDRCKDVLTELSEKTGDLLGEHPQSFALMELLEDAVKPLQSEYPVKISCSTNLKILNAPKKALTLAIRSLVKNALEASAEKSDPIAIEGNEINGLVKVSIKDNGRGMNKETQERLGEPLFSTKEPGRGIGLGVYLSKLTVEQLGGSLKHESAPKQGTTATLLFPANCALKVAA